MNVSILKILTKLNVFLSCGVFANYPANAHSFSRIPMCHMCRYSTSSNAYVVSRKITQHLSIFRTRSTNHLLTEHLSVLIIPFIRSLKVTALVYILASTFLMAMITAISSVVWVVDLCGIETTTFRSLCELNTSNEVSTV